MEKQWKNNRKIDDNDYLCRNNNKIKQNGKDNNVRMVAKACTDIRPMYGPFLFQC